LEGTSCKNTDRFTASASRAALVDFFTSKFPRGEQYSSDEEACTALAASKTQKKPIQRVDDSSSEDSNNYPDPFGVDDDEGGDDGCSNSNNNNNNNNNNNAARRRVSKSSSNGNGNGPAFLVTIEPFQKNNNFDSLLQALPRHQRLLKKPLLPKSLGKKVLDYVEGLESHDEYLESGYAELYKDYDSVVDNFNALGSKKHDNAKTHQRALEDLQHKTSALSASNLEIKMLKREIIVFKAKVKEAQQHRKSFEQERKSVEKDL
jgi:hypothetical protein